MCAHAHVLRRPLEMGGEKECMCTATLPLPSFWCVGVLLFSLYLYICIYAHREGEKSRDCAERMITHTMPTNLLLHPSLSLFVQEGEI